MSTAPTPHIATYELRSSQQQAPRWLAVYMDLGVRLPPAFEGSTEAEAYGAACAWWESEQRLIAKARIARGETLRMISVPRTKGKVALIDDKDADAVLPHVWRAQRARMKRDNWYAYSTIEGVKVYLHRFLTLAANGTHVDHRDGDGLNNRRKNLRRCTRSQNNANIIRTPGKSGYIGVYFHPKKNKFQAAVYVSRKQISAGYFRDAKDAALARDRLQRRFHGEFGRLNFGICGEPLHNLGALA